MHNGSTKLKKFLKDGQGRAIALANYAKVHTQIVYRWADGTRKPSDDNKVAIEKFTKGAVKILDWFPKQRKKSRVATQPSARAGDNAGLIISQAKLDG